MSTNRLPYQATTVGLRDEKAWERVVRPATALERRSLPIRGEHEAQCPPQPSAEQWSGDANTSLVIRLASGE